MDFYRKAENEIERFRQSLLDVVVVLGCTPEKVSCSLLVGMKKENEGLVTC